MAIPLSAHARAELVDIAETPIPRFMVNPGVSARLERNGFVETVFLVSPFKTHKGKEIQFLKITAAGRKAL